MARQLDRIVIGGMKLYVNIPKYKRERRTQEATGRQSQSKGEGIQTRTHRVTQDHQTKQLSYVDAVRGENITQRQRKDQTRHFHRFENPTSSVHLDIHAEDIKWLEDAWVERLKNPAMFDRVEDDLQWELGMDITPKYLGDDLVLLHGLSEIGAERVMNGGTYGNASLFYSMERWNPSIRTGNRMIWVQCWGIPLQTWDKKHIR